MLLKILPCPNFVPGGKNVFLQLNCSFPVSTGVPAWGVPVQGDVSVQGGLPGGCLHGGVSTQGGYHVTYPIMHLMLPVCCLHTS